MNHHTQDGLAALRALIVRAARVAALRCIVVALVGVAIAGSSSLAADPVGKSGGAWSWFKPKKQQPETTNPFDNRAPSQTKSQPAQGLTQPNFIVPSGGTGSLEQPQSYVTDVPGLSQPKWMRPQSMVVVTDDPSEPAKLADAMPLPPTATAQHSPNNSRPVQQVQPTRPGAFGLLQGLAGTNVPSNTAISNASTADSQLERSGTELARQVAGTSQPQAPPNSSPTNNTDQGLFTAWTDAPMQAQTPQPSQRTPVQTAGTTMPVSNPVRQTSATRTVATPAVAASDPTAGLWNQMGFEPPQDLSQAPPTVPSGPRESIWSALMRPATITSNSPTVPRPPTAAEMAQKENTASGRSNQHSSNESEEVPDLFRPFYYTNSQPAAARSATSNRVAQSVPESHPLDSSLARQLMLSSDEYLRTAQDNSIQPTSPRDPGLAAAAFVNQWSSMQNPFTLTQQPPQMMVAGSGTGFSGDATQVSYLQESLPEPNGAPKPDEINLPGDDANKEGEDKDGDGKKDEDGKGLAGAKKLGTAPEDNTLEFLRSQTVLLKPGDVQCDIGFTYSLTENDFPILVLNNQGDVVIDELNFRSREVAVPIQVRYGVTRRVQAFIQVPVGWSNNQAAIDGTDIFQNDGGLGDIFFGAKAQLCDANQDRPYLVGSLTALAPTGGDPFSGIVGFSPSAPSLGNGFWQLGGSLLWIETRYDPVIVFYGLGAAFSFEHSYIGVDFQPGPQYTYTFGYGFAVNERVTLSTQLFGAYQEELKANGTRLPGTNQEPINVQLAATFLNRCDRIVEPFVTFGLTDDAVSSTVGITWTY